MERKFKLFHKTLLKLGETGVLSDIILIGSWCLYLYRAMFNDSEFIPAIRTVDIDFLIPNPPRIRHKVNVSGLLEELGFVEEFSQVSGCSKFIHPDLEVEFIIPEKGRGKDGPHHVKEINVNAQGLRYVSLLQGYVITVPFDGLMIKVPEPAAFALHKFQISKTRNKKDKKIKDLETAIGLGEFLISRHEQVSMMRKIFSNLPAKWKKEILEITKAHAEDIYLILKAE